MIGERTVEMDESTASAMARMEAASERMGEVMQGLPALLEDEFGLSRARLFALGPLARGPASQAELADATMTSPSACSRLVSGMVDDGLVVRERAATDGRVALVRLTEEGVALAERLRARTSELFGEVVAAVGAARAEEAADALELLLGALADAIDRARVA